MDSASAHIVSGLAIATWDDWTMRLVASMAVGFAAIALKCILPSEAAGPPSPGDNSIVITPGREFAATSYVHKPLSADAPLDPKSRLLVAELLAQVKQYYGTIAVGSGDYSPPIFIVGPDQPTVRVLAKRGWDPSWSLPALQQKWLAAPLPSGFEPAHGSDKEAVVYQPSTGRYWEFWAMERTGEKIRDSAGREVDEWRAGWGGAIDDLSRNEGYFQTPPEGYKFGATATGLPYLAGVMTIKEQQRGVIEHPLHFAIPKVRKAVWSFPAQRTDGLVDDPLAIPEGATFRFPANLDFDAMDLQPYGRMVAKAIQKYGMILRDTAGAVVIYAENPSNHYASDPYSGPGGILDCPNGAPVQACWPDSNNRLRGVPWEKLQVVQARTSQ